MPRYPGATGAGEASRHRGVRDPGEPDRGPREAAGSGRRGGRGREDGGRDDVAQGRRRVGSRQGRGQPRPGLLDRRGDPGELAVRIDVVLGMGRAGGAHVEQITHADVRAAAVGEFGHVVGRRQVGLEGAVGDEDAGDAADDGLRDRHEGVLGDLVLRRAIPLRATEPPCMTTNASVSVSSRQTRTDVVVPSTRVIGRSRIASGGDTGSPPARESVRRWAQEPAREPPARRDPPRVGPARVGSLRVGWSGGPPAARP